MVLAGAATTMGVVAKTLGGSPPNDTAPPATDNEPGAHWPCTEFMNSVMASGSHSLKDTGHSRRCCCRPHQESTHEDLKTHACALCGAHFGYPTTWFPRGAREIPPRWRMGRHYVQDGLTRSGDWAD